MGGLLLHHPGPVSDLIMMSASLLLCLSEDQTAQWSEGVRDMADVMCDRYSAWHQGLGESVNKVFGHVSSWKSLCFSHLTLSVA